MLIWGHGINRFCINSTTQSLNPARKATATLCYFYLGSDLVFNFLIQFLFLEEKVLDLEILEAG